LLKGQVEEGRNFFCVEGGDEFIGIVGLGKRG